MSQERLLKILLAPHISEKSSMIADKHNHVVFKVARDATKPEIKQAVESLFNVNVKGVTVVNVKGKRKRFGRLQGRRPDWKKAYVALAPGQEIDFLGNE
ncbi:MAG: 50S ribosomal protein L23 [Pseudomonadota bacterium]|nr:50S ribosomal protein L23 [Pseudomonadota bacterium]